jgi:hypothetical protein
MDSSPDCVPINDTTLAYIVAHSNGLRPTSLAEEFNWAIDQVIELVLTAPAIKISEND